MLMDIRRGDVVTINLGNGIGDEKGGLRPAVILSNNKLNSHSDNVIIAPLTKCENKIQRNGRLRLLPAHIFLSKKFYTALKTSSIIQLEDIRSVSKSRINNFITELSTETLKDVETKLEKLFGII